MTPEEYQAQKNNQSKRRWYEAHKEEQAAYRRRYYQEHREEICRRNRKYQKEHRAAIAAYKRRYYLEHIDSAAASITKPRKPEKPPWRRRRMRHELYSSGAGRDGRGGR